MWLTDWLTEWLIDSWTDRLIEWLMDWLIGWSNDCILLGRGSPRNPRHLDTINKTLKQPWNGHLKGMQILMTSFSGFHVLIFLQTCQLTTKIFQLGNNVMPLRCKVTFKWILWLPLNAPISLILYVMNRKCFLWVWSLLNSPRFHSLP